MPLTATSARFREQEVLDGTDGRPLFKTAEFRIDCEMLRVRDGVVSEGSSAATSALAAYGGEAVLHAWDFCEADPTTSTLGFGQRMERLRKVVSRPCSNLGGAPIGYVEHATWNVNTTFAEVVQFTRTMVDRSWEGYVLKSADMRFSTTTEGQRASPNEAVKVRPDLWGPVAHLELVAFNSVRQQEGRKLPTVRYAGATRAVGESSGTVVCKVILAGDAYRLMLSKNLWCTKYEAGAEAEAEAAEEPPYNATTYYPRERFKYLPEDKRRTVAVNCDYRGLPRPKTHVYTRTVTVVSGPADSIQDIAKNARMRALAVMFSPSILHYLPVERIPVYPTGLVCNEIDCETDTLRMAAKGAGVDLDSTGDINVPPWQRAVRFMEAISLPSSTRVQTPEEWKPVFYEWTKAQLSQPRRVLRDVNKKLEEAKREGGASQQVNAVREIPLWAKNDVKRAEPVLVRLNSEEFAAA